MAREAEPGPPAKQQSVTDSPEFRLPTKKIGLVSTPAAHIRPLDQLADGDEPEPDDLSEQAWIAERLDG